jgi:hypothetical protein
MSIGETVLGFWDRYPVRFAVALALAVRALLLVFVLLGARDFIAPEHFPHQSADGTAYIFTPVQAVDAWARWDAVWYVGIAQNGYRPGDARDAAFFPLYPLTIRAVSAVTTLPEYVSALLIANALDILGWVWFALLARQRLRRDDDDGGTGSGVGATLSLWALLAFALFPTRNFGFSAYTEGMFLASSVGAFLAYERKRYGLAALAAACASATRPPGLFVALALIVDAVCSRRSTRWKEAATLLGGFGGIAAYVGWLAYTFGDPLRFNAAQSYWHREFGNPLRVFLSGGEPLWCVSLLLALGLCISMLRQPAPLRDCVFCVLLVLVPMLSGSMMSMARFMGVIFPLFIFAAGREPSRAVRWSYAVLATLYACFMAYRLGQGDLVI